jgi:hypothetical protein
MRSLSAQELLDIWEVGQGQIPVERALDLLVASNPGIAEETFARMPIGEREGQILDLREQVFGPYLEAVAGCPACGDLLEMTIGSFEIRAPRGAGPATIPPLQLGEYWVQFRLPDSRDLVAIAGVADVSDAQNQLLERCILEAKRDSDPLPSEGLPIAVRDALIEAMEIADPQANTSLSLTCPSCGENWQESLDILAFFWSEIENWAAHTLNEVHLLAMAYGWTEFEALSLSAARRQMYLERVTE